MSVIDVDAVIARAAARRHGVVTRRHLLAAGISPDAIDGRVRRHALHVVHRGVYAVGHPALALEGRVMAALLACGDDAVASHATALVLWGVLDLPLDEIDVTSAGAGGRRRAGIASHRSVLAREETTRVRGVPVTGVERALIDTAETGIDQQLFEHAVDQAQVLRRTSPPRLRKALAAARGRRGAKRLAPLLAEQGDAAELRARTERALLRLCRDAGLPAPELNARTGPFRVDALWRAHRLALELDGFRWHRTRRRFDTDHALNEHLEREHIDLVRVAATRVLDRPIGVAALIAGALARREP